MGEESMIQRLTEEACVEAMGGIPDWSRGERDGIQILSRVFSFADFLHAFEFMSAIAVKAEEIQHHPEWFNVYNRVEVTLTTHDCDGLSALDFTLAAFMDERFDAA
jgi:4a-hydroxytetrahydrobiopterin dehydratase